MTDADLRLETHVGAAIAPYVPDVADFRIRGFRAFPYLYAGTAAYERHYLEGYTREPRALLIRVLDGARVAAVATAVPLASSSDVVAEAPSLFAAAGYDPRDFYYYAEILVDPAYRGRGVAKMIYREREAHARAWGYGHLCLAVVKRAADHPLRPDAYEGPERIWIRDGFAPTAIEFPYRWPTIQPDGSVEDADNPMVFWVKRLTREAPGGRPS